MSQANYLYLKENDGMTKTSIVAYRGLIIIINTHTLKTEQVMERIEKIGQALGLLVLPSTRITTLTHAAYQPGSLPGTLLAYAMGNLILRLASRLDAFSVYPIRT